MIKIQDARVFNLEGAITGMRFPMQSWEKSDSIIDSSNITIMVLNDGRKITMPENPSISIGPTDLALAQKLIASGADSHSKFLRQIFVSMNITAPLYWWKEMDQYRVGVTTNSESTMHRLAKTPITIDCFSFDTPHQKIHDYALYGEGETTEIMDVKATLLNTIYRCEFLRQNYLKTKDPYTWRLLIQLLPSSWNQMRHWTANYAVLRNIYANRRTHKLQEWKDFCEEIEKLPYGKELITFGVNNDEQTK